MASQIVELQEQIKELEKQVQDLKQKLSRPHLQGGRRLSIADNDVINLRKGGQTIHEIANQLSVSTATVCRILRENKVKVNKVYNNDVDTVQMSVTDKGIIKLRIEGNTVKTISEQLNVSTATVNRILMKNNIRASKFYNDTN